MAVSVHLLRRKLNNNKITGSIPDGLGNSTALTYLCVAACFGCKGERFECVLC